MRPRSMAPHKTLYNPWKRWGDMGVFLRMMEGLAVEGAEPATVMIDATYLKAHRAASSLRVKKGDLGRLIGRTKGGMNTELHAVTDANGRPLSFFMTAEQISDYTGTAALLDVCPERNGYAIAPRARSPHWPERRPCAARLGVRCDRLRPE